MGVVPRLIVAVVLVVLALVVVVVLGFGDTDVDRIGIGADVSAFGVLQMVREAIGQMRTP